VQTSNVASLAIGHTIDRAEIVIAALKDGAVFFMFADDLNGSRPRWQPLPPVPGTDAARLADIARLNAEMAEHYGDEAESTDPRDLINAIGVVEDFEDARAFADQATEFARALYELDLLARGNALHALARHYRKTAEEAALE
jgi:hypothetical protein